MKFQGETHFQTPRDQVWAAIVDPQTLLGPLSGFQRLDPIGTHEYEGAFEVSVGDVRGDFQGTLELADLKPPSSLRFSLNAMGAAGFIDGDGLMVLEEADGGTRIHYDLDAKIGGRIATVGERTLEESARALARQALNGLGRRSTATAPSPRFKVLTKQEVSTGVVPAREKGPQPEPSPVEPALDAEALDAEALDAEVPAAEPKVAEPDREAAIAIDLALEIPTSDATSASGAAATELVPENESTITRQGQYGSKASRGWPERFEKMIRRPGLLAVGLVLYTLLVVLVTRSCS